MKQIEAVGKRVEDAIANGLKELGVSQSEVDIEIITMPGGFLGLRKAKVRLTLAQENPEVKREEKKEKKAHKKPEKPNKKSEKTEKAQAKTEIKADKKTEKQEQKTAKSEDKKAKKQEKKEKAPAVSPRPEPVVADGKEKKVTDAQVATAKEYLQKMLALMKIKAELKIDATNGGIDIDIVTTDTAVIGHRGETLDALQVLTKRAVEGGEDKFVRVVLDSNGYRAKREETLVKIAEKMAQKCIRTGRKVVLEPMSNNHRKIIHSTLSSNEKIITKSEGKEPNRRVVIMLKRNK